MKLGIMMSHGPGTFQDKVALVQEAERLGFDSVWTSEAWGGDAVTPATWYLADGLLPLSAIMSLKLAPVGMVIGGAKSSLFPYLSVMYLMNSMNRT